MDRQSTEPIAIALQSQMGVLVSCHHKPHESPYALAVHPNIKTVHKEVVSTPGKDKKSIGKASSDVPRTDIPDIPGDTAYY